MTYQTALQRATALCAGSEHCIHDIQEKLRRWELPEEEALQLIDYLVDEKYIDEERFARAYAKDKMRYNRWGRQKIDQGLRLLEIASPLRRQALEELPESEYREILTGLLQGKLHSVKARNDYDRKAKLIRFALGRGFEMNLIYQCMPELEEVAEGCDWEEDGDNGEDLGI